MIAVLQYSVPVVLVIAMTYLPSKIGAFSMYGQKTCGHSTYDPQKNLCCDGVLQDKRGYRPQCCGKLVYDTSYNMCCDDKIVGKPPSSFSPSCCGEKSFDGNFNMCCDGELKEKRGVRPRCCGTESYDAMYSSCCEERLC